MTMAVALDRNLFFAYYSSKHLCTVLDVKNARVARLTTLNVPYT